MILGLVCARKGSVGLPDKNIRELKGVKLIERAILKAWEAGCDRVVVSTDYLPNADFDLHGATWRVRPDALCGPDVSKWHVWRDTVAVLDNTERHLDAYRAPTVVVDIDVTRPLCTAETVRKVIEAVEISGAALAVALSDKHPAFDILHWGRDSIGPYADEGVTSRQQLMPVYLHAGCYAFARDVMPLRKGIFDGPMTPVIVDRIQSYDIDDELDWRIVEALCD